MELDERKRKILKAIIQNYLETGEPVGSRTISKYTDLNLSSATIRNEMSDLEELGLIIQPHTSAGRIPTDQGYRFYVDEMLAARTKELEEKEKEVENLKSSLLERVDKVEDMLKGMAKQLALDTNYATMITSPVVRGNQVKFIQLSQVEPGRILCVVVLDGNLIKNQFIKAEEELNNEEVIKLNIMLNTSLAGLTSEQINMNVLAALSAQIKGHEEILKGVMKAIMDAFASENSLEIYTSGATNIFKYPELSDREKASELISTLEEKQQLTDIVQDSLNRSDESTGISVYIGNETPVKSMKDCSVVTATYELGEGVRGTIGIIGPKRMDYERVLKTLKEVRSTLDEKFKENNDGKEGS